LNISHRITPHLASNSSQPTTSSSASLAIVLLENDELAELRPSTLEGLLTGLPESLFAALTPATGLDVLGGLVPGGLAPPTLFLLFKFDTSAETLPPTTLGPLASLGPLIWDCPEVFLLSEVFPLLRTSSSGGVGLRDPNLGLDFAAMLC
jgi:hypothetical protein